MKGRSLPQPIDTILGYGNRQEMHSAVPWIESNSREAWREYARSDYIPDIYYADLHIVREISFTVPHLEAYKDKWGRTQYTEILH